VNKSLYAQQVLAKLSDAQIADASAKLGQLGALTDVVYIGRWIDATFPAGARGYIYQMRCVSGNIYLWLAFDAQGKIATILFKNRLDVETVTPSPSPVPSALRAPRARSV
jgi:putative lipase involved disintegration of autophagic bodies